MRYSIYLSAAIIIVFACLSCNSNASEKKESVKMNTEVTDVKQSIISGKWKITKYVFSEFSAMDDKTAGEWLKKTVSFSKDAIIPFKEIPSYKEIFPNDTVCKNFEILRDTVFPAKEFFIQYNSDVMKLGITSEKIRCLSTNSPETPVEEIFVLDDTHVIIRWDGVFFYLEKEIK